MMNAKLAATATSSLGENRKIAFADLRTASFVSRT